MTGYVYVVTNKPKGVLYIGATSNLIRRVWEHKEGIGSVFTTKYHLNKLVFYEAHDDIYEAIKREKQMKKWNRAWKVNLIESQNHDWIDLYRSIC